MRGDRYAKSVSDPAMNREIVTCIRDTFTIKTRIFFSRELAKAVKRCPWRYPVLHEYSHEKDLTRWVSRWLLNQGWETYGPRSTAYRWVIPAGFLEVAA